MIRYFIVDAFTKETFAGNPAGVCLLEDALDERLMQRIATENNLPETAFVHRQGQGYALRWFTPEKEIDLCGHATLATAFVLSTHGKMDRNEDSYIFDTMSGKLTVTREEDLFVLDFPARPPRPVAVTDQMRDALGARINEAYMARDLMLVLDSAKAVTDLHPDMEKLKALPEAFGVIATAAGGEGADFVSRFFAPGAGIPEDPVTGSSHTTLIPFWAERLGKKDMTAHQLSQRGGVLSCRHEGDRVLIAGHAVLYLEGNILL